MNDMSDVNYISQANATNKAENRVLDIVSLYPKDMNIYGDYGNVLTIMRRAELYGYKPVLHEYNVGDDWPKRVDMVLGGGGQDHGQSRVTDDLFARAGAIRELAKNGVPMLMICGLYQLFGEYFETIEGQKLKGIGILGEHTVGPDVRVIGNLVEHSRDFGDIVGYENHSGRTSLESGTQPLGSVDGENCGNNGEDHTEGARKYNVIGTYMHGSVLPKNPRLSDFLIRTAAQNRYGEFAPKQTNAQRAELEKLDKLADRAREVAVTRPR